MQFSREAISVAEYKQRGKLRVAQGKQSCEACILIALHVFLSTLSCECKIFFLRFLSVDDSWPKAELTFYRSLGIPYLCTQYSVLGLC